MKPNHNEKLALGLLGRCMATVREKVEIIASPIELSEKQKLALGMEKLLNSSKSFTYAGKNDLASYFSLLLGEKITILSTSNVLTRVAPFNVYKVKSNSQTGHSIALNSIVACFTEGGECWGINPNNWGQYIAVSEGEQATVEEAQGLIDKLIELKLLVKLGARLLDSSLISPMEVLDFLVEEMTKQTSKPAKTSRATSCSSVAIANAVVIPEGSEVNL